MIDHLFAAASSTNEIIAVAVKIGDKIKFLLDSLPVDLQAIIHSGKSIFKKGGYNSFCFMNE